MPGTFIDTIKDADTGETYGIVPVSESLYAEKIELSIDSNYKLTAKLKNADGTMAEVISESTVDLPMESIFVDGEYNTETKHLVFTLQNGKEISIPVDEALGGCLFTEDKQTDLEKLVAWYEDETYKYPTVSANSLPGGGACEKGDTKVVLSITARVTKGSSNVVKLEALDGNAVIGVIEGTNLTGVHIFSGLYRSVSSNKSFTVKATCADGKTKTATTELFTFVYPYYWGAIAEDAVIDEDTIADFIDNEILIKKVAVKGEQTLHYAATNQKMVFASPYSVNKITDPNGFDVTSTFTKSEVSITGLDGTAQPYYVYIANNAATISDFNMTFVH